MTERIIYPNDEGGIHVVIGNDAVADRPSLEEIAKSVVPSGVPYRFVETTEIPTDRENRAAWAADFSAPDGFGEAAPLADEPAPPAPESTFTPGTIYLRPADDL